MGTIALRSTQHRNYRPEELELARALAHQASLAIQLTQLAEQQRQTAVVEERKGYWWELSTKLNEARFASGE